MPGLDGLRAVAVLGVIAYHLGLDWIPGGLLGVGVFFTLSGYLITDILLTQLATGGIKLKEFWFARARRLLPAVFVLLIVVMAWVTVFGPHQPADFRNSAFSAVAYTNNWYLIFHDVSYFAQFSTPEPLNHLWSLSVEEQFYLLWPFLLIGLTKVVREAAGSSWVRPRLGDDDPRAGLRLGRADDAPLPPEPRPVARLLRHRQRELKSSLVGAALAAVWPSRRLRAHDPPERARTDH